MLFNHRQQVVEGSRWISRAASSVTADYAYLRSQFIRHATTEHRDYGMIEQNCVSVGGQLEHIQNGDKNLGSEALHSFMMYNASKRILSPYIPKRSPTSARIPIFIMI